MSFTKDDIHVKSNKKLPVIGENEILKQNATNKTRARRDSCVVIRDIEPKENSFKDDLCITSMVLNNIAQNGQRECLINKKRQRKHRSSFLTLFQQMFFGNVFNK
jgi:hypothetical protein